jgi:hypothetical protein
MWQSWGLLLGIQTDFIDVLASSDREYLIKHHIHNKVINFAWSLVVVYGAAQKNKELIFLYGLVNLAKDPIS